MEEVKNLESAFLPKYLGKNKKILHTNIKKLTAAGENYGSLMLALDIKIENKETGKEESLQAVAKAVPSNEYVLKIFKSPLTFKKELEFYRTIVPTLRNFQLEQGMDKLIDCVPQYYGGRLGMGDGKEFDENAVILMENLKLKGYSSVDRTVGYDFKSACGILKDLAALHAIPLAIKLKQPNTFKEKILPYINIVGVFGSLDQPTKETSIDLIVEMAKLNDKCVPYVARLKDSLNKSFANAKNYKTFVAREPFATLIHCDVWVNNILHTFDNGIPIQNKLVDYQVTEYNTPARDLLFFIFDSLQSDVIINHYEDIVKIYHKYFLDILNELNVDTTSFNYEKFLDEIEYAIRNTEVLFQCFIMLGALFADNSMVREVENINGEDMVYDIARTTQKHRDRLWLLVLEFAKRNWL